MCVVYVAAVIVVVVVINVFETPFKPWRGGRKKKKGWLCHIIIFITGGVCSFMADAQGHFHVGDSADRFGMSSAVEEDSNEDCFSFAVLVDLARTKDIALDTRDT